MPTRRAPGPDDLLVDSSARRGVRNYPTSRPGRAARREPRWPSAALLVAAAACGLFALYLCQSKTAPFNSDG
ncbi:MAG: hypothetical protein ACRDP7_18245, partial [Trebonia sp.]